MNGDLFRTKREQVFDFIKEKKWAKTSAVIEFGLKIYHTRADRDARDWAEEAREQNLQHNFIRRMSDDNKRWYFGGSKEDVWEYCP